MLSSNGVTALRMVADISLGFAFRTRLEGHAEGNVAVLQMKDITESSAPSYAAAVRLSVAPDKTTLLRAGDLVFRSRGRSYGAALVVGDVPPAILAAPLLLIRPTRVLPEYLHWFINSDHAQAQLASVAVGTAVQQISAESLRALEVPVPPEEVQRRIAEVAQLARREEELTGAISKRRRQLTNHILLSHAYRPSKGEIR
ncbi:MAG: restriction endonuclease subunit S [Thermoanaerobaculia bacterium]